MHHAPPRRATLVVALVVVLTSVAATGTVSVAAAQGNGSEAIQHADPAQVDSAGDLERVRGWLDDRLTERLEEQSIRLSSGEYEAATDVLDGEFEQRLSQYVEVASETGAEGDGDGEAGGGYQRAQRSQRELVGAIQEYESTYEDYRAAHGRGDDEAAHQYARELQQTANRIDHHTGGASNGLRTIEEQTATETDDARERLSAIRENVSRRQAQVRQQNFVETSIEAAANRSMTAFNRPAAISGRIQTSRNEPIANKNVTIQAGNRSFQTATDGEGRFAFRYRPVSVSADVSTVNVTYRPSEDTPYLPASTMVDLAVRQVGTTINVTVEPRRVGLGTDLGVAAPVTVEDSVVPDLPIRFSIGDRDFGTRVTDPGGVAVLNWTVPPDIQPGEHVVRAEVGPDNGAVGPRVATTNLSVAEAPTQLAIEAQPTGEAIAIQGRLSLASGAGSEYIPADLPVVVTVADRSRTVQIDENGRFELSMEAPQSTSEEVTVRAEFGGAETNLQQAADTQTVTVAQTTTTDESGSLPMETLAAVGGAVFLVLVAVAYLVHRRRRGASREPAQDVTADIPTPVGSDEDGADLVTPQGADAPIQRTDEEWLAGARTAMGDGDVERAVASAYAAAHGNVTARLELDDVLTPRELLTTADGQIEPEAHEALTTLTDVYERVVFASEVSEDAGELAIYAAATVLEADDAPEAEPDGG